MSKNRVDQLRHDDEPNINRKYVSSKPETDFKQEIDIKKKVKLMKTENITNSGVQRLLRHLRKAKLEQIQHTKGVIQNESENDR